MLAELTEVLLLPQDDDRFASCVVVHGMGGTGKTVTAVAAVQESGRSRALFRGLLADGGRRRGGR